MSFLYPTAFVGLASIVVLILLSLWRLRPVKVVVPSLRLWREIPDRLPPVRAWRSPQASLSLLLQILAAAALIFAMAGPGINRLAPAPRRIAVVVDGSAAMSLRKEAVRRELDKLDRSDDLVFVPTLDLAASEAKTVVYVSDREPSWTPPAGVSLHRVLVGGPIRNVGIIDAGVESGKLFLRLSAPAEVRVSIDGEERKLPAAAFHLLDVPGDALKIEASLDADEFKADDQVVLHREEARIEVGFEGRPDRAILAAIEADPRARVVRGGSPHLLIRIGPAADRSTAPVVVEVDPPDGVESWAPPETVSLARHPLTEGMDVEDLKLAQVAALSGPVEAALILSGGAPVAAVRRAGEIAVAVRYAESGWPATPSFPIFWSNVLGYASRGAAAWRAQGLLNEAASPGTDERPFDPSRLEPRPHVPLRNDLTAESIALAALLLAVLWFVERRRPD